MNLFCAAMEPQTIIMIVVVVVLLAAIIIVPMFTNRKRQKQVNDLHGSLEVGDTVTTVGGIIGKVVEVKSISPTDKQFTLKTGTDDAPSTMTFDINAIYLINNKQGLLVKPAAQTAVTAELPDIESDDETENEVTSNETQE